MTCNPSIPTSLILRVFHSTAKGINSASVLASLAVIVEQGQVTMEEIVKRLKLTRHTALHAMQALEEGGFITVERGFSGSKGRKPNIYRIKP